MNICCGNPVINLCARQYLLVARKSYPIDGIGVASWLFGKFFHVRWKILFSHGGEHVRWTGGENGHMRWLCVVDGTSQHTHPQSHLMSTSRSLHVHLTFTLCPPCVHLTSTSHSPHIHLKSMQGDFVWWRGQLNITPIKSLHNHLTCILYPPCIHVRCLCVVDGTS